MELLLWFILDVLVTGGLEFLAELTGALDTKRKQAVGAIPALVVVGVALGALSGVLAPGRLFPPAPVPGLSLLVVPVILGVAMQVVGGLRSRAGKSVSHLATWYGGAALGVSLAAGRILYLTSR